MKKMIFQISMALAVCITCTTSVFATTEGSQTLKRPSDVVVQLQPGVSEYIRGTYFEHASEYPDSNEPVEVLKSYLLLKGSPKELDSFKDLVKKYPNSRHSHIGLANASYDQYKVTKDKSLLSLALDEALTASKIGLQNSQTLYLPLIKQLSLESGQPQVARNWFDEILIKSPNDWTTNLQYADLLQTLKDSKAESYYRKAIEVRPTGNLDANASYSEYLLDHKRYEDALKYSLLPGDRAFYVDFLHGYALEQLGRGSEATKYYQRYIQMSKNFPAPSRFQMKGSPYQKDITFQSNKTGVVIQPNVLSGSQNLSFTVACEATAESTGAMRQVAYTVRQRVNRGTIMYGGNVCVSPNNSGTFFDEKYANVICQATAYGVSCDRNTNVTKCSNNSNQPTATTNQVASDVYNGYVPDPYTGYCATGWSSGSNTCTATCTSSTTNLTSFTPTTPHSFLKNQTTPPYSCFSSAGKVCGNGGNDNSFFYTP